MPDLLIRDLSPATHAELKRRAKAEGKSVQAYVASFLEQHAARPSLAQVMERIARFDPIEGVSGADAVAASRDELP